jgi:single-strand DNA-binding protein
MGSLNRVQLIGHLGKDPEVRFTANGVAACHFSIATTEQWTDAQGQKQERTEWHRITAWAKLGEACGKFLAKGRQVYVEGKIQTRSYDKDGQTHYATEIIAHSVVFLGGGARAGDGTRPDGAAPAAAAEDDIPFAWAIVPFAGLLLGLHTWVA